MLHFFFYFLLKQKISDYLYASFLAKSLAKKEAFPLAKKLSSNRIHNKKSDIKQIKI